MSNNQFFITSDNIQKYIDYLRNNERAAATIEKYIRDVRVFANFLNGEEISIEAAIQDFA